MKRLSVAIDIYDEFYNNGQLYTARHIDQLMAYCRSLGATSIDWVYDDMWAFYDAYPGGLDLLRTAADAAHAHGLEFWVVYKPFEGALGTIILPHSAPRPADAPVWDGLQGRMPIVRPFAAAHPELCLQRRPSDTDPGGAIRELRLIKDDDAEFDIEPGKISLWTGRQNGRLERWQGDFTVRSSVEWRPLFPLGRSCRVLTICGLEIPASERYVDIRFADDAFAGSSFRCDYEAMVEPIDEAGRVIPHMVAASEFPRDHYARQLGTMPYSEIVRYGRHPEVQAFVRDVTALAAHCRDLGAYGRSVGSPEYALDERRQIAFARGKEPYLRGILNPVYPEVREEWLATIERLIARGVDGVNLRASSHLNQQELWAYGFNEPVLAELEGEENVPEAGRIMGQAYTRFLREAGELLHGRGRKIGVHLLTNFIKSRDEGQAKPTHEIMEWEWQTWVAEIADMAVIRGSMGLRWESLRYAVDLFAGSCRRHGVPVCYQSNRRAFVGRLDAVHLHPDRLKALEYEMAYALGHPCIDSFQYYETANFTGLDAGGRLVGSQELVELSRRFGLLGE